MRGPYMGTGWHNPIGGHHNTYQLPQHRRRGATVRDNIATQSSDKLVNRVESQPKVQIDYDAWRLLQGLNEVLICMSK